MTTKRLEKNSFDLGLQIEGLQRAIVELHPFCSLFNAYWVGWWEKQSGLTLCHFVHAKRIFKGNDGGKMSRSLFWYVDLNDFKKFSGIEDLIKLFIDEI